MELLTAEEVALMLKCSKEFVYQNKSLLGAIKIGRLVRYSKNKIREVIYGRETRNDVEVRLSEMGDKIQEGRISNKGGSKRRGSKSENNSEKDEFGLYKIVRESITGCEDSQD